jgi:hypothetical protein
MLSYVPLGTEKIHDKPRSGQLTSRPRLEWSTSRMGQEHHYRYANPAQWQVTDLIRVGLSVTTEFQLLLLLSGTFIVWVCILLCVIRDIYNDTVCTTIILKKRQNRYYCINICLLAADGNATCFDPFIGHLQAYKNTGSSSWIASTSNMDPYCAYMGFYTIKQHLNLNVVKIKFKSLKIKNWN